MFQYLEKMLLPQVIDHYWHDHLPGMNHLREESWQAFPGKLSAPPFITW